ncbi:MAG: hypothetical protein RLZZ360_407 [Candidatus Parcubacteria bacterium]|jgi:hypothetical protein
MKFIIAIAIMLMVMPFGMAEASTTKAVSNEAKLYEIEQKISHIRMLIMSRVLGASTSNYFMVTSNGNIIAQSYVPVTVAVAQSWCADMKAINSFKNTTIVCTQNGVVF